MDYPSRFRTQTLECTSQEVREVDAVDTYVYGRKMLVESDHKLLGSILKKPTHCPKAAATNNANC
jgi:hypothetical protein